MRTLKNGITLNDLATEVVRQRNEAKDFLIDTHSLSMGYGIGGLTMNAESLQPFGITDVTHSQIGTYLGIPAKYYERMRDKSPQLLTQNVNHWLHSSEPQQRMIRTLDGKARAFLSDKYRRIDNADVAETVLPMIGMLPDARVESCEITDTRMYLKVVNPRLQADVRVGDTVQSGILITNSEVGLGSVNICTLIYRLVCSNGMVAQDASAAMRKYHIGRQNIADSDMSIYRDETIEADNRALIMKIQDAVRAATEQAVFASVVERMREATEAKIEPITVPKVVELASSRFGITQNESEGVLGHLIEGGDLSLYGMANAVTRYAQDVNSYDRSTELEAAGYKIMTMSPALWGMILSSARKEV